VVLPMLVMLVATVAANAQALNGTYTIGGTSPNYSTFALACAALNSQGVAGPVVFNVRPGTYTSTNTAHTIGNSGTGVTGTSPSNTVTFQPDPANPGAILINNTANSSSNNYAVRLLDADY